MRKEFSACLSQRRCLNAKLPVHREPKTSQMQKKTQVSAPMDLSCGSLAEPKLFLANLALVRRGGVREVPTFVPVCDVVLHHLHPDFDGLLVCGLDQRCTDQQQEQQEPQWKRRS